MIESILLNMILTYGPGKGCAVCLGDQIPTEYTGFKTARELFLTNGYSTFYDIDYNGKAEVNHDLNFPIPAQQHNTASLLFDGGVLEHVTNIGCALQSIVKILQLNGVLIMANPVNCYGRSYYGISPMLQRDFFEANGFRTLHQVLYWRTNLRIRLFVFAQRFIPTTILERIRLRLQRSQTAKSFIFRDEPRFIKSVTPKYNQVQVLPTITNTIYIGQKLTNVPLTWPCQCDYPNSLTKPCS
jgi:hypothetical protein